MMPFSQRNISGSTVAPIGLSVWYGFYVRYCKNMGPSNQIEVFNDLIRINEELRARYMNAMLAENESAGLIKDIIQRKEDHISKLREEIKKLGGWVSGNFTGRIYEQWISSGGNLCGDKIAELPHSCAQVERMVIDLYGMALACPDINAAQRFAIRKQHQELISQLGMIENFLSGAAVSILHLDLPSGPKQNAFA